MSKRFSFKWMLPLFLVLSIVGSSEVSYAQTVTITAQVWVGGGTISPVGQVPVPRFTNKTFTASPDPDKEVDHWELVTNAGEANQTQQLVQLGGNSYTCSFASSNETLRLYFKAKGTFSVYVQTSGPGGSLLISGEFQVAAGAKLQSTALPESGYQVATWFDQVPGEPIQIQSGGDVFNLMNIEEDHLITVTFESLTHIADLGYTSLGKSESDADPTSGSQDAEVGAGKATGQTGGLLPAGPYPKPLVVDPSTGFQLVPIPADDTGETTAISGGFLAVGSLTAGGRVQAWSWYYNPYGAAAAVTILPAPSLPLGQALESYSAAAVDDSGNIVVNARSTGGVDTSYLYNSTNKAYSPISTGSAGVEVVTTAITPNGQFAVGMLEVGTDTMAFEWSKATGAFQVLGDLGGVSPHSRANAVSTDGAVVVGYGSTPAGRQAFRWTQASGMLRIPDLANGTHNSTAESVTADGSGVVGQTVTTKGPAGFIWITYQGTVEMQEWLLANGTSLPGYTVNDAPYIDAMGSEILLGCVGTGDIPEFVVINGGPGFGLYAEDENYSANWNTELEVPTSKGVVSANFNGGGATVTLVTAPKHAESFVLNADGSFDYTPATNFSGDDSFQYKFSNYGATSNFATVHMAVFPNLATLTVDHTIVYGGDDPNFTLTYTGPVPASQFMTIPITQSKPADASLNSVFATAGTTSSKFTAYTNPVTDPSVDKVTASFNGISLSQTLTFESAALVDVKTQSPSTGGGSNVQAQVDFDGTLFANETVTLSSSSAAATVPPSVPVLKYLSQGFFTITTKPVTASTVTTIKAQMGSKIVSCTFTVLPAFIAQVAMSPTEPRSGMASNGTVTLNGTAPTGATVALTSADPTLVTLPASVPIGGTYQAFFTAKTKPVAASTPVLITATYAAKSVTTTMTILPAQIYLLSVSAPTIKGGATVTVTVHLNGDAATPGLKGTLGSSNAAVTVPPTATVLPGYTVLNVVLQTHAVTTSTPVTITASFGGVSKTALVTVTP